MMTNLQCYSYGIMAIKNLRENKKRITPDSFYYELYDLWDFYTEKEIEEMVKKLEKNKNLF